jgi:hypothetical protein
MMLTPLPTDFAPAGLPVERALRYEGDGFALRLEALAPEDQEVLRRLYQAVRRVGDQARPGSPDTARIARELRALEADGVAGAAEGLGRATRARPGAPPALARVLHDVRGGGLPAVAAAAAAAARRGGAAAPLLAGAAACARDHARILRNAVADLDPAGLRADDEPRVHAAEGYARRWGGAVLPAEGGRAVRVGVECSFPGAVAGRGREAAAVDRVLYDHLNNAARFGKADEVRLALAPAGGGLVRWVVSNALADDQRERLRRAAGGDPRRLYRGGLTRDGDGRGLADCAEVVAAAFGLLTAWEAVEKGYLGAVVRDHYHAWFHWPAFVPPRAE